MRQHPIFKLVCDGIPQWLYTRLLGERWAWSCRRGHEWQAWRVPYSSTPKCPTCGEWACSGGSRPSNDLLSRVVRRIHSEAYMRALDANETEIEAAHEMREKYVSLTNYLEALKVQNAALKSRNAELEGIFDRLFTAAIEGSPELTSLGLEALLDVVCDRLARMGERPVLAGDASPVELHALRSWETVGGPRRSLIEGE